MSYSKEFYKHCDTDDTYLTLHDCIAKNIYIENGVISFCFENGFWVAPDHEHSNLNETVRTDSSRVDFYVEQESHENAIVYVFQKNLFGSIIRKEWSLDKLIDLVNNRVFSLEFSYQYKGYNEQIIDCGLHSDKKLYRYECQLKIPAYKVVYCWNNLCKDKKW